MGLMLGWAIRSNVRADTRQYHAASSFVSKGDLIPPPRFDEGSEAEISCCSHDKRTDEPWGYRADLRFRVSGASPPPPVAPSRTVSFTAHLVVLPTRRTLVVVFWRQWRQERVFFFITL